jgi:hypothetical protein
VSELSHSISGEFFKAQEVFEAWSPEETWGTVEDAQSVVPKYPANISSVEGLVLKPAREYLCLAPPPEVDPKAAAAAKKKGGKDAGAEMELNDNSVTEEGQPLPRVHVGREAAGKALLSFRRHWTLQQVAVRAQQQAEEEAAAQRQASSEEAGGSQEGADGSGGNKGSGDTVGGETTTTTGHRDSTVMPLSLPLAPSINITEPEGPELDPLMCAAFRLVGQYAKSFGAGSLSESTGAVPYLWGAIYPQLPNGTPCYNPAGKYCVKLFVGESSADCMCV